MADDQRTQPTEDDAGKDLLDSTGETIGIVSSVEGGTLHVESDPGLTDSIKATLGWGDTEDTRTIEAVHVSEITDDAVHLAADDPEATEVDSDAGRDDDSTTEAASTVGETGTGTGHEDEPLDTDDVPPEERRDDPVDGEVSGDETAAEMDDAGGITEERTAGEAGPENDSETMDGRDANERPPGVEDSSGREDVHDSQMEDPRGEEDVQDPVPEEPSTGEAATRGVEEEGAELGREDEDDEDRS